MLVGSISPLSAALETAEIVAPPGTIVRWAGEGIEACEMDGRVWTPLGGACLYPIDLLRSDPLVDVGRRRNGSLEGARIRIADYPYPVQYITLENDSQVNLSESDLRRVRAEQKRVAGLWDSIGAPAFELPLASPLRNRGAGGRFGSRRFFNDQPRSPHSGVDYAAPAGEAVFSAASGRVVLADDLFFSGRSVFIDHGDGLVSMYFHLSETLVETGDQVGRTEQIGRVGQTGRATGPHLHFGIRWKGARVDPELLLSAPEALPGLP